MVGAAVVVSSTIVVRSTVLSADTYLAALDEVDAFERVYTEALADPELAGLAVDLVGGTAVRREGANQARGVATAALRWAVPPSTLRGAVDATLNQTFAYLRGERDRFVVEVDASGVLERLEGVASAHVGARLAELRGRIEPDLERYRAAVDEMLADLERGVVPERIPVWGGRDIDLAAVAEVLLQRLEDRAGPEVRERVETLLSSGADREALTTVAIETARQRARAIRNRVRADVGVDAAVDLVRSVDERARTGTGTAEEAVSGVKRVVGWFGPRTTVGAAVVGLLALGGIWWIHRRSGPRAGWLVGGALALGGLGTAALWAALRSVLAVPIDRALGAGEATSGLPPGTAAILSDLRVALGGTVAGAVRFQAVVWLVAGVVLAAAIAVVARTGPTRSPNRYWAAAGLTAAVVLAATLVELLGLVLAPDPPRRCNGHAELCDRPYDEVVQAATHNSMSSPDVVVVWPEHDGDLRAQLDAGVRVLLIDTHYWTPVLTADALAARAPEVARPVVDAVHQRAGSSVRGREGTFLCHNHCVFGGIPFLDALGSIRAFLDENPDEVVTLVVQDAISVADTEAALAAAKLDPFLYEPGADASWPTLGDMVDDGTRLVVFAEEEGPPPGWYLHAWDWMQETPYLATSPEALSCRPNRGDPDATLFLLNHWVQRTAPDRVDATVVNARDFLVARARECAEQRGQVPNFLAVNFYGIGDLMGAVDELNGLVE